MKVTHVNTFCTGGAAKASLRIVKALNKAGSASEMLVLYKTNKENKITDVRKGLSLLKNYVLKIRNKLFVIDHSNNFGNSEELFSSYNSVWNINENELIKNADVVNLHWVSGFVDLPSFITDFKKKIVFTLHDHFPFSGGYHYPNAYFEKTVFQSQIKKNLDLLKELYPKADMHFVGPSQYIIDELQKIWGPSKLKTSVIKNPVDPAVFYLQEKNPLRLKLGYKAEDKILLFINELNGYKRKGFHLFAKMIPELIASGFKIVIVGEKNSEVKQKEVRQVGYLNSDAELNEYYNMADALVCCSLDDNLPNIISEANCAGTPVFAFKVGGIPEMIEQGVNGCLVEKGDTTSMLTKLKEFAGFNFDKRSISTNAHTIYSEAMAAKKYLEIYKNA